MALALMAHLAFVSYAQVPTNITSDNSLGTQVTPNGNVFDITGGTRPDAGPNLFHSFGQFTVGGGDTANFSNDSGLATSNILGRVTGGDPSNIYGTIQTTDFPGANLFLVNPAGVLFGPEASLNVSGSFYATTADFVRLGEDGIFFADLGKESVLTIAPPTAFGFLGDNPEGIALDQSELIVAADKTLSLVGGDVDISGAQLTAPNGNIILASVSSPGEVTGIGGNDIQVTAQELGSIGISNQSLLKADGAGGGTVLIRGGSLMMVESQITANTTGPENGPLDNGPGEGIDIQMTGDVVLDKGTVLETIVAEEAPPGIGSGPIRIKADRLEIRGDPEDPDRTAILTGFAPGLINSEGGQSGDIEVTANSMRMQNARIDTEACCTLDSGDVMLSIRDSLEMETSTIRSASLFPGTGKAGGIDINVQHGPLSLTGGSTIQTVSIGGGGNISVTAGKEVLSEGVMTFQGGDILMDDSSIFSLLAFGGQEGGNVQLRGRNLDIRNGGALDVQTIFVPVSDESAGALTISLTGNLTMTGVDMSGNPNQITVISRGGKPSGGLTITAKDVVIADEGAVFTEAQGIGRGGNLNITAENLLVTEKGAISSSSNMGFFPSPSFGDAGNINLDVAGNVIINKGGSILAGTSTEGDGGSITIAASGLSVTDEGSITAESSSTGDAGNIIVNVNDLTTDSGAVISSSSTNEDSDAGTGGTIELNATNSIDLSATTVATSAAEAEGGDIAITAGQNLQLTNETTVLAESSGAGNSGSVTLTANSGNFSSDNSTVSTTAVQAEGGDIAISAGQDVALSNNSTVSAQSFGPGNAGDVTLTSGNDITMTNSSISTEAAEASGGNIKLSAPNIIQLTDSKITSSVLGGQATQGGNINLDPVFIILQNSEIRANAIEGNGGNITLTATGAVFIDADSVIDASSETGISGTVTVNSPVAALAEVVAALPKNFVIPKNLFADACAAQAGGQFSSFTQGAPAALPPAPGGFLSSPLMLNAPTMPPSTGGMTQGSTIAQSRLGLDVGLDFTTIPLLPPQGCAA